MRKILGCVIFLLIMMTSQNFAGIVYYVDTNNGNDSNPGTEFLPWRTIQKAANTMVAGDTVIVKAGTYRERINESTNGSSGNLITYEVNEDDTVTVEGGFTISGNYIKIDGFRVTGASTCNWSSTDYNIYISGDYCEITNCYIYEGKHGGLMTSNNSNDCIIRDSEFYQNGSCGIEIHGSHQTVENCEIHDTRCGPCGSDADGIFIYGSNHQIKGNYIHDITFANNPGYDPHIDAFQTAAEHNHYNIIFEGNYIDLMEWKSQNAYGKGWECERLINSTIKNNIIRAHVGVATWPGSYASGLTIVNNTFVGVLNCGCNLGSNCWPCAINLENCPNTTISNNITVDWPWKHIYISGSTTSGLFMDYNCTWNSDGSSVGYTTGYGPQPHDLWETDPKFMYFSGGDYHLAPDSPCIDTGSTLAEVMDDFDGNSRPYGAWYDMGSYEYVGENPPLNANANASPTSGETPLTVNFTGNATGGTSPYSFSWDFGDGGYSTEQNPSHTYYVEANYTAILTVTDNEDSHDSDSVTITVTAPLTPVEVSGSASPISGDSPLTVYFTGNATGGTLPYSYYWSFGDGQSSNQQNLSHTYNTAGNYTATLTVTDSNNNQDSDSLLIIVTNPATPLVASSSASPNSGDSPLTVYFTGNATGGTLPYSYYWNFGDGQSSTQQNPSHTYNNAGNYSAILTVRDSNNNQDSDSMTINVTAPPPPPLVASCIASPTSGNVPFTVYFTGSASGGIPPYSYSWNFGDGGNSTQQNPSHTYNSAGNYTVTLTVTDSQSLQDSVSLTITANISPTQAYLSCSPTNLYFGASVSGVQTGSQNMRVINAGDGTMTWNVQESTPWLSCSPLSGTNRGQVTVSFNASGLSPGTYSAIITVSSPQAYNSPQLIEVNLRVYEAGIEIPDGNPFSGRDSVVGLTLNDIKARRAGIKKNSDPNNPTEAIESGGLVTIGNTFIAQDSTEKENLERPELNTPYREDETGRLTIGLKDILIGLKPQSTVDIDTEEDRIAIDQIEKPTSIIQKSQLENEKESVNIKRIQIEEMEPLRIVFISNLRENISFIGWGEDEQTLLPIGSTLDTVKGEFSWIPPFGSKGKCMFHFAVTDGSHRSQPLQIEVDVIRKATIKK